MRCWRWLFGNKISISLKRPETLIRSTLCAVSHWEGSESGLKVEGSGFGVQGSGFGVQGSGFGVQGSGFGVQGSGFRVPGSGFRVQGLGFRVQVAAGFRAVGLRAQSCKTAQVDRVDLSELPWQEPCPVS